MADDLVTVARFQFLPEADAARAYLEGEGLRVFLADYETVNMDWLLGNAIGNIKLQVISSQADKALALLESIRAEKKESATPVESDVRTTPRWMVLAIGFLAALCVMGFVWNLLAHLVRD
jgi:hypothetical protein